MEQENFKGYNTESMESSIMSDVPQPPKKVKQQEISGEVYTPQTNQYQEYQPQTPQQNYNEETYSPESYAPQDYEYSSSDSDVVIEIAEQVFQEKIKKLQKHVDELTEFKTLTEVKINDFSERLKRIETMIDNLQISILDKVGSYGKNLESAKKEIDMMQDSFRKIVNSKPQKEKK